jgi:hypothetical protein
MRKMRSIGVERLEVLRTVVSSISVSVMDHFLRGQAAPKKTLHHQAVLEYPSPRLCVRVSRDPKEDVSILIHPAIALPIRVPPTGQPALLERSRANLHPKRSERLPDAVPTRPKGGRHLL